MLLALGVLVLGLAGEWGRPRRCPSAASSPLNGCELEAVLTRWSWGPQEAYGRGWP